MYLAKHKKPARRAGLGDALYDFTGGLFGTAPADPNAPNLSSIPTSTDPIDSGPTTQVVTEGGQASPIPSSQPGGGFTTSGGFMTVAGVCKPTDGATLEAFKNLQRQANRVADAKGLTKVGVDGAIGAQTLALMTSIKAVAAGGGSTSFGWVNFLANQNVSSCSAVAGGAVSIAAMLSQMADYLGASSSVASPAPASPPQIVNPTTGIATDQGAAASLSDLFKNLSTPMQIAAVGAVGAAAYFIHKSSKKGRR